VTTTLELVEYYASLLILQYLGKPRASATISAQVTPVIMPQTSVQTVAFSLAPTSGTFVLSYGGVSTSTLNWNDSAATIQTALRAVTGLSSITVTGAISDLLLTVTFTGVTAPAALLVVESNSLLATATAVDITVTETDEILPLAVENGFNVIGTSPAVGDQLDVLGKYAGVSRTGAGFSATITLDDADFLSLIKMAITVNSSGSSLADIQNILHTYFPSEVLVFDYKNMKLSYLISTSVGSQDLIQLFITEGLLPRPMGVQVEAVIYAPSIANLFGFRTYSLPAFNASPFNSYSSYQTDWPWLSYANAILI
jgi:hypothetical protein